MSSVLQLLSSVALWLGALKMFSDGLAHIADSTAVLKEHFTERYLLHYCGSVLAAERNLDSATAKLISLGAPETIPRLAEDYRSRLLGRLASMGKDTTSCQARRFFGYQLSVYEQNPDQPEHWPNFHYTLTLPSEAHDD